MEHIQDIIDIFNMMVIWSNHLRNFLPISVTAAAYQNVSASCGSENIGVSNDDQSCKFSIHNALYPCG